MPVLQQPQCLAGMQPYFFPYIGYFELINRSDCWIVADVVQYIERGWMHRNRILAPSRQDWQYISASLQKQSHRTLIKDVLVKPGREWRDRILRQIEHYKKDAPYFDQVYGLVQRSLEPDELSLSKLNVHALSVFCEYLGIRFEPHFCSDWDLDLEPINKPADWALRLAEQLKAGAYINPPGGADLYDEAEFRESGIKLIIQKPVRLEGNASPVEFEPSLSMINICMWNSPEAIKGCLDRHPLREVRAA